MACVSQGALGRTEETREEVDARLREDRIDLNQHTPEYGEILPLVAFAQYLQTLGRGKVGFSVVGRSSDGRPIHVGGVQGVIERNAMRYHLAVKAYLETLEVSEPQRFERRIERWFGLTSGYRGQLFEMERDEYLRSKRQEWANQARLQEAFQGATRRTVASTAPAGP